MQGYRIIWYFDNCSIFIWRSWWIRRTEDSSMSEPSDPSSNEGTVKSYLTYRHDYDDSDEYMRNYKNLLGL